MPKTKDLKSSQRSQPIMRHQQRGMANRQGDRGNGRGRK